MVGCVGRGVQGGVCRAGSVRHVFVGRGVYGS